MAILTLLAVWPGTPSAPIAAQTTYDCATATGLPQDECEALVALYNATDGANWTDNTNWLATTTPCDWYGVTCTAGQVTHLGLAVNQLNGEIPPELGNLSALTSLSLGSVEGAGARHDLAEPHCAAGIATGQDASPRASARRARRR